MIEFIMLIIIILSIIGLGIFFSLNLFFWNYHKKYEEDSKDSKVYVEGDDLNE